jgi:hypothetical protein
MRHILLVVAIALFINGSLFAQANKMKGSPSKYHFNIATPENSWRKVPYKELTKENPDGLEILKDSTLLYFAGYVKKGSKNIKAYPSLTIGIYSRPKGLRLSDVIQDQNDTISIHKINSLTGFKTSTIFFDSKTSSTFLKTTLPDGNLLYMQVYFSQKHMAFIKMYINAFEEASYAGLFLDMVKASGFEEKYRLQLK